MTSVSSNGDEGWSCRISGSDFTVGATREQVVRWNRYFIKRMHNVTSISDVTEVFTCLVT